MNGGLRLGPTGLPWAAAWLFAGAVVTVALLDLLRPTFPLYPFVLVPVVASSVLASPRLTLGLTGLSILLFVPVSLAVGYPTSYLVTRMVIFVAVGGVSALLASSLRRAARRRDEESRLLDQSERRFRLLAENAPDVVVDADEAGRIRYVSPAVHRVLGFEPVELVGEKVSDLVHPDDRATRVRERSDPESDLGPDVVEVRLRGKDGTYVWVARIARAVLDPDGRVTGVVESWRDVDEQVRVRQDLLRRARLDELTGVLNRREALQLVERLGQAHRRPGVDAAVLFLDVDAFKDVNDAYGHAAGDAVLRALTDRTAAALRGTDVLARIGGDEFVVLLEGLHGSAEAEEIARKILMAARAPVLTPAGAVVTTVSIGVAMVTRGESADGLMARADSAMYRAKREGRDRVVLSAGDGDLTRAAGPDCIDFR